MMQTYKRLLLLITANKVHLIIMVIHGIEAYKQDSSTFEFTVFKKAIKSDTPTQKAYSYLNERAWVSFKYHGKSFIFNVMQVEENEQTIKCYCENLNLELINEVANPYKLQRR